MPFASANGASLYYEATGAGFPLMFVHEFGGDYRSWEPQVRYFSRRYLCVTYNARGYPPSDVPKEQSAYSQAIATDDLVSVLRHLRIPSAHIVGLSMGGFATLYLGLRHAMLARSLVVAGCGYGSMPAQRTKWQDDSEALARLFETGGAEVTAKQYAAGPYRRPFRAKDPRGWDEFVRMMSEHSAVGCALTQRGVQKARPSVMDWGADLRKMTIPTLIIVGDSDDPCIEPNVFLKRTIPSSQLCVFPNSGHQVNLEEPDLFNRIVDGFLATVEARASHS